MHGGRLQYCVCNVDALGRVGRLASCHLRKFTPHFYSCCFKVFRISDLGALKLVHEKGLALIGCAIASPVTFLGRIE